MLEWYGNVPNYERLTANYNLKLLKLLENLEKNLFQISTNEKLYKFQVSKTDRLSNNSDSKVSSFEAIKICTTAGIALDRKSKTKKETKIANQSLSQTLCRKLTRFKRIYGERFKF